MPLRKRILVPVSMVIMILTSVSLFSQDRFFDTDSPGQGTAVLTICYPTLYSIRSVLGLQEEGLLPVENLIIAGVFHEEEVSDYAGAMNFIRNEGLEDRFVFHAVRGALNPENLYGENPCTDEYRNIFSKSDAVIFFGGADMPPELYGRKTSLLSALRTPMRHYFELSFIFHLLGGHQDPDFRPLLRDRPDFPVLGLCLGEQSINAGTGGTLVQDIWSEVYGLTTVEDVIALGPEQWHNNPWPNLKPRDGLLSYNLHRIRLSAAGKFVRELGFTEADHPYVVSSHHQAVSRPGRYIRVIATSMDGRVAEAIEHERFPNVLGLQFHPEFSIIYDHEKKVRIDPDQEPFTIRTMLEENSPSFAFHQKIWEWFADKLHASADGR
ncbi:gamma-glutamyl-gamma-aminobutyrate hydrolase family protein [bacterium]|nr:gamma-glutamyl-gamma-aminobutyrate hydrolase family protein [bacterium]